MNPHAFRATKRTGDRSLGSGSGGGELQLRGAQFQRTQQLEATHAFSCCKVRNLKAIHYVPPTRRSLTLADKLRTTAVKELRAELAEANLKWASLSKCLPDWYSDAICTPSGLLQVKTLIAKQYGLALSTKGKLFRPEPTAKALFKTQHNTLATDVEAAQAIGTSVAKILSRASITPYSPSSLKPNIVREKIEKEATASWVDFQGLVDFCWGQGIPVAFIPTFPVSGKKMEGMVTKIYERPCIILSKKADANWMLFILAHELGHIAKGHLETTESGTLLDEKVSDDDTEDLQEQEANDFASQLLASGKISLKRLVAAQDLADMATEFGKEHKISPGHVILNAAKHTKGKSIWPLAQAALKLLPPEANCESVDVICSNSLIRNIDIDLVKPDDIEFLERLKVLRD